MTNELKPLPEVSPTAQAILDDYQLRLAVYFPPCVDDETIDLHELIFARKQAD